MKWMKWLLVLALGAGLGIAAIGCDSDDDDNDSDNPLAGTWVATAFNGQPLPAGISMTLTLRDDGTAAGSSTINGATETYNGTWTAANGTLSVTDVDGTESLGYTVEGDTLTLTDETGAFTLERR